MEQHYSIKEAARRLAVSETTVRKYLKLGRLRAHRIGRVWRISESAVAEFLETNGGQDTPPDKKKGKK